MSGSAVYSSDIMRTDIYGRFVYTQDDLCDLLLIDPQGDLSRVLVDSVPEIHPDLELENPPKPTLWDGESKTVEEFDALQQLTWHMPDKYKNLDIVQYLIDRCTNEHQLQRVAEELLLYADRGMFQILQYLVYLVDTMRAAGVVWGVGRGSSVCSYVLYLIGVHRIDSLYYDLDIADFLK